MRNFEQEVLADSSYSINVGCKLLWLDSPIVMGILNATPDSFYLCDKRSDEMRLHIRQMLAQGATIIDVGGCSTRPDSLPIDEATERLRLREALSILREEALDAIVSVDTFRASIAKMCVEEFGVQMVNDIGFGQMDKQMFQTVAQLGVPYVLTHNTTISQTNDSAFMAQLLRELGQRVEQLHELGLCDIIIDPGFGFGKTLEQNYILMRNLEVLHELNLPLLVGVSHKSMIYKLLNITAAEARNGTTALHTIALQKGAHILRAHEVKEAKECIEIVKQLDKTTRRCQA